MADLTANWKTTGMGLAVCALALERGIHFDVAGHLLMTARDWFTCGSGVLAAAIGVMQKDAGSTVARTETGAVKAVGSHEQPDDAANVAVTESKA